jgi:hypothetical protein
VDARWLKFGVPWTPGTLILCDQRLNSVQPWTLRPPYFGVPQILVSGMPGHALTELLL